MTCVVRFARGCSLALDSYNCTSFDVLYGYAEFISHPEHVLKAAAGLIAMLQCHLTAGLISREVRSFILGSETDLGTARWHLIAQLFPDNRFSPCLSLSKAALHESDAFSFAQTEPCGNCTRCGTGYSFSSWAVTSTI